MKSSVEPLEGNKVKLSVEVDEHEFEAAVDSVARKLAREVRIPGFRPGKAPRRLLEARLGKAGLRQEAMRDALPGFYAEAVRQAEIDAIAPPEIDITGGEDSGALVFDAVVEVRPTVSVAGYQGLQATIPSISVTDDDIDQQIDRMRQPYGELREVDRPAADGDHITISITGSRAGEEVDQLSADDLLYQVGSGDLVAELDDQVRGAKPGDILTFDSEMAGEPVSFRVLVKDVKELVLPDVTDEWAKEASEFDTVAELRADLHARLEQFKKVQASLALRDAAIGALADLVTDDPPEPLVRSEMESRLHDLAHRLEAQGANLGQYLAMSGQGEDEFVEGLRAQAAHAVKADLALRALAEAEGIEVTEADVDDELARLAERLEQDPFRLRAQLDQADQLPAVRSDIRKAKALGWLMEHVEIVDEEGNPVDRAQLQPHDATDTAAETETAMAVAETETDRNDTDASEQPDVEESE